MKYLLKSLLFGAILIAFTSCQKENIVPGEITATDRPTAPFTMVYAEAGFQVEIIKGSSFSVTVETPDGFQDYVYTSVVNGELQITVDKSVANQKISHRRVLITMPKLTSLVAVDGAEIKTTGIFDASNMNIEADNGGFVLSNISSDNTTVKITNGSDVELHGETGNLFLDEVSSKSRFFGFRLWTENAEVNAINGSEVEVTAISHLKVDASGASIVKYAGSPTIVYNISADSKLLDYN